MKGRARILTAALAIGLWVAPASFARAQGIPAIGGFSTAPPAAPAIGTFAPAPPASPPPEAAAPAPPAASASRRTATPRPAAPARAMAVSADPRPTFTPESQEATERAMRRYEAIAASGGWPRLAGGAATPALRQRLVAEGDLASETAPAEAVRAAIRRFQLRHGLRQSGTVDGATLAALNVPVERRVRQLSASLARMRASTFGFGTRYVVVNIPSASVEAVESGQVRRRYVAVVGKKDRASPPVETRITSVNFNPTWTVPTSIIRKDIIPRMQRDPGYLTRAKIRILDSRGTEINPRAVNWSSERAVNFTLRQDPGAGNSLGRIKIDMPNNLAVYMHDTPSQALFARDDRFHSSGCVRVADVKDFATWLLSDNRGWDRADTDEAVAEGERRDVRLTRPVPVAWTYYTAWASPDGAAHFRQDIYDLDATGGGMPVAIRNRPLTPGYEPPSPATGGLETVPLPEPAPAEEPSIFRGWWR
jgi:murein L,D-transpeptidase YcbB/YkuD